jgi:hypothetical protein
MNFAKHEQLRSTLSQLVKASNQKKKRSKNVSQMGREKSATDQLQHSNISPFSKSGKLL